MDKVIVASKSKLLQNASVILHNVASDLKSYLFPSVGLFSCQIKKYIYINCLCNPFLHNYVAI